MQKSFFYRLFAYEPRGLTQEQISEQNLRDSYLSAAHKTKTVCMARYSLINLQCLRFIFRLLSGWVTSDIDSQSPLNAELTHAVHHIRWICSSCSLYWCTNVSLISLCLLPLTTAVRQACTWEKDLRTRLALSVSTMHHSPLQQHCGWEWRNQGYLVPAKDLGLLVKLYDWESWELLNISMGKVGEQNEINSYFLLLPQFVRSIWLQMAKSSCALSALAVRQKCPSTSHAWSLVLFSHELTKGGRKSPRGLARLTNVAWLLILAKIQPVLVLARGKQQLSFHWTKKN